MSEKLNRKDLRMLQNITAKHAPELFALSLGNIYHLHLDQINELREAVGAELIQSGFDETDEPNQYGVYLEGLIDKLGRAGGLL